MQNIMLKCKIEISGYDDIIIQYGIHMTVLCMIMMKILHQICNGIINIHNKRKHYDEKHIIIFIRILFVIVFCVCYERVWHSCSMMTLQRSIS